MPVYIDTEIRSEVDISCGLDAYQQTARVLWLCFTRDDGPVQMFDLTQYPDGELPEEFVSAVRSDDLLFAHNAPFDRLMLERCYPWLRIPLARWRCTMAQALSHSLPPGLDDLCVLFKLPADKAKQKDGKKLIGLFSKPRKGGAGAVFNDPQQYPAEWTRFGEYCAQDVAALREVHRRLPTWNYPGNPNELENWFMDQRINARGMQIDVEFAKKARSLVDAEQEALRRSVAAATHGEVTSGTQRAKVLRFLGDKYGVAPPDLKKSTVAKLAGSEEVPDEAKMLLALRTQATTSSTAKYSRLLASVGADCRLRYVHQYAGASRTLRWAGRGFQPLNLPRLNVAAVARWLDAPVTRSKYDRLPSYPTIKEPQVLSYLTTGRESIIAGAADLLFPDRMALASNLLRSAITAAPGKHLVVVDYANIESRVTAWLAGAAWKLDAFKAYDAKTGPDMYRKAYAEAFGVLIDTVEKWQRTIGKVMELMLQYQGGVGSFITGAATNGIDLGELADRSYDRIPEDVRAEALAAWDWAVETERTLELDKRVWVVCDSLKRLWRRTNSDIVRLWAEIKAALFGAVTHPGVVYRAGRLRFKRVAGWLLVALPSGRFICYLNPRITPGGFVYLGMDQETHKWGDIKSYEGKMLENCAQAISRDILAAGMRRLERVQYPVVLHIYDEPVVEHETASVEQVCDILCQPEEWYAGLPLAASGFITQFYRKGD